MWNSIYKTSFIIHHRCQNWFCSRCVTLTCVKSYRERDLIRAERKKKPLPISNYSREAVCHNNSGSIKAHHILLTDDASQGEN